VEQSLAGNVPLAIVDAAGADGADVIVMGTRGRSDLKGPAAWQRGAQGDPAQPAPCVGCPLILVLAGYAWFRLGTAGNRS
jgi:hypothetical protein